MGLLAVLSDGPLHAYEMRRRLEDRTGGTWPVNMGQISTTLTRLVKADLVHESDRDPARDVQLYDLTDAGRAELATWWTSGPDRTEPERDELTMKVALALTQPGIDVEAFLQVHRAALVRSMQDLTRLKRTGDPAVEPLWALTLERMLLVAEAEVHWLDLVAARAPQTIAAMQRLEAEPTPSAPPPTNRRDRPRRRPMSTADLLLARGLTRTYPSDPPVSALRDLDLSVAPGEMVAVMGPSGSGKSTLLQLLGGLDTPTAGSVLISGKDIAAASPTQRAAIRRQHVGYVFQDFNLIPSLSAIENVTLPLELDGVRWSDAHAQAIAALATVAMTEHQERRPGQLSGGQQQRVAVARALVGPRRLLLADEPTGALDSITSEEVMRVLRGRVDDGAAAVVVTHDSRAAAWADRVVFLRDGVMVDTATGDSPEALLDGAR